MMGFVTYFSDNLGYFLFVYLMFVSGFFREREIIEARWYGDANDGDRWQMNQIDGYIGSR